MAQTKTEQFLKQSPDKKKPRLSLPVVGFVEFISKYSIIGMAIGIVIGQTTKDTVNAMVTGIVTPAIQLFLPNTDIQNLTVTVRNAEFHIGLFFNAVIEMLIIMAILYFVIGILLKRVDLLEKK